MTLRLQPGGEQDLIRRDRPRVGPSIAFAILPATPCRPARPTLAAALETLIAQRAIVSRTERPSGPGRPITTYRLA
jgi:hypothetical protein